MQLPQPNTVNQPLNQQVQEFEFDGKIKNQNAALALVIQDTQRAEKYLMSRLWMSEWRVSKAIYEAAPRQTYWRDTLVPRASNSYPLVAQHIRALLDQAVPAVFPDSMPVAVDPNPGTPRQIARGWEAILHRQIRQLQLREQLRLVMKDALIFGTGIGKWGWETYEETKIIYKHAKLPTIIPSPIKGGRPTFLHTKESDALDEVEVTVQTSRPTFNRVEINHLLVAPGLRSPDVRKAAYVVYRDYLTIRDLNRLRGYMGYHIPNEEELKKLAAPPSEQPQSSVLENESTAYPTQGHRALPRYLDESDDPLEHKLEVLEHWTKERVIVVLQRKLVIRDELNPLQQIPFVSCYWDDTPGTFYSFGLCRRIGSIQMHLQGLRNLRLDDIHMNLQNMWMARKGSNIAGQPIRMYPGAVFKVDDMESLKPVEKSPVLQEAYKEEEVLSADAEKTSGANEMLIQGAMPGGVRSTGMRSGTGAGAISAASSSRVQSFVNVVCEQCLLPVLYAVQKMDRLWLDPAEMRKIVGKDLWQDMEGEYGILYMNDMCNADEVEFGLLAGSNIAAKQRMMQAWPLEAQMYMAPAVQQGLSQAGMKVDWLEFARRNEEATDWKATGDIIVPMTQDDKQRQMQMNPAMVSAQATRARLAQQHQQNMQMEGLKNQNKLQQIDAQGMANAGETALTKSVERALEHEETPELTQGMESMGAPEEEGGGGGA
jgi:hypothetical protein